MIDQTELDEIREINRRLPFAAPIGQSETIAEYNDRVLRDWWAYA